MSPVKKWHQRLRDLLCLFHTDKEWHRRHGDNAVVGARIRRNFWWIRNLCFLWNPGLWSDLGCWKWPDKWGLLAHLGQKAEILRFIAHSDEGSEVTLMKTSLCYMCLVLEELSDGWLLLLVATTGRSQNDRNAIIVALRLIKPMGSMPFHKEIIMFEKIQNKNDL